MVLGDNPLQMPLRFSRKQLVVLWLSLALVFSVAVGATVWISTLQTREYTEVSLVDPLNPEGQLSIPDALPDDVEQLNVLLLGYGGPGHQGGYLTDAIQLVQIDFSAQQVNLISLPRDLFVQLPTGKHAKLNTAFTLGEDPRNPVESGGVVAKRMVEQVTGLQVDHYMAVDFVGFQRVIGNWLGGIDVMVGQTLDDPWYPVRGLEQESCGKSPEEIAELTARLSGFELEKQFPCRYERVFFEPGLRRMEGGDALAYVRSRHGSAGGDFSRSQRQHEVLDAIQKKIFTLESLQKAPESFTAASEHVSTDFTLEDVTKLAPLLKTGRNFSQKSIVLSTENVFMTSKSSTGQFILQPKAGPNDWSEVHAFLTSQLGS